MNGRSHFSVLRSGFVVIVATLCVAAPAVAEGQVPAAWFGTWVLNVGKSTYDPGPAPYRRATYEIQPWQDGLKVIYELVYPRGGVSHLEWTGRLDGRDYPVQGLDEVLTYAYHPLPDGSYEVVVKIDGRITARSVVTLSQDGRTMTTKTAGKGARGQDVTTTTVYEKR